MNEKHPSSRGRAVTRGLIGALFLGSGILHFLRPEPFVEIVPSYLPGPVLLVYVSGFFEIAGAIGLQIPRLRQAAGWGLIALLLAVFPVHIFMLTHHPLILGNEVAPWVLWLRLPLQFVLMALVWWSARPPQAA